MADDGRDLTQREKRAQRHKVEARKGAPGRLARKAALPAFVIVVLAGVAAGFWYTNTHQPDCPTHWHGTFGVFVPSATNASSPQEVSFRSPYYSIGGGMPERAHMHQEDGFNQMHFEQAGTCVGVQEFMRYVEVRLDGSSIELRGHHAELGQTGSWKNTDTQHLHAFVEACQGADGPKCEGGSWAWEERSVKSILGYQLKDGEKILVYMGDYSEAQVHQMESTIHDPVSRVPGFTATQGVHPTGSASTSAVPASSSSSSSSGNTTA